MCIRDRRSERSVVQRRHRNEVSGPATNDSTLAARDRDESRKNESRSDLIAPAASALGQSRRRHSPAWLATQRKWSPALLISPANRELYKIALRFLDVTPSHRDVRSYPRE